jgi:hypothetical protein
VLCASADATRGGHSGFGLPDSRDHLVVVLLIVILAPLNLASRGSGPYASLHQMGMPAH